MTDRESPQNFLGMVMAAIFHGDIWLRYIGP